MDKQAIEYLVLLGMDLSNAMTEVADATLEIERITEKNKRLYEAFELLAAKTREYAARIDAQYDVEQQLRARISELESKPVAALCTPESPCKFCLSLDAETNHID